MKKVLVAPMSSNKKKKIKVACISILFATIILNCNDQRYAMHFSRVSYIATIIWQIIQNNG